MKTKLTFLFANLFSLCMYAQTLTLSTSNLTLGNALGSTATITVTSNTSWTVRHNHNQWFLINMYSISPLSFNGNQTLTVYAYANPGNTFRYDTLIFEASGLSPQQVVITQDGLVYTLSVSENEITMGADAGTATFGVNSNTTWTVNRSATSTWLYVNNNSGSVTYSGNWTITLSASKNPNNYPRSVTLKISCPGLDTLSVDVIQEALVYTLTVPDTVIQMPAAYGSTAKLPVQSNTSYQVNHSDLYWLLVNNYSGNGGHFTNDTLTLMVYENKYGFSRTDTLTLSVDGISYKVPVIQEGAVPTLSVSATDLTIGASENSTRYFSVTSNTIWEITSSADWLNPNVMKDTGSMSVILYARANPKMYERTAIITVSAEGVSSQTISVTQSAGAARLSLSKYEYITEDYQSLSDTFTVFSNTSWSITNNNDWVSLDFSEGQEDKPVTFTLAENPEPTSRNAILYFTANEVSETYSLAITQQAWAIFLNISTDTLEAAASENSTVSFDISSNAEWTVLCNDSWISMDKISGTGNATVTLTLAANLSEANREAVITISDAGSNISKTITVMQAENIPSAITEITGERLIYPNPVEDALTISLDNDDLPATVEIYNLNGNIIVNKQLVSTMTVIDISGLESGTYVVRIITPEHLFEKKILKL